MTAATKPLTNPSAFVNVDDGYASFVSPIPFGINGVAGYTTFYIGTNGYMTFTGGAGTNGTGASNPSIPAIKLRGYDERGISCTWDSGVSSTDYGVTYVRIVASWYAYFSGNQGLVPLEIYLIRDTTNARQLIWIKIGTSYNNASFGDADWGVTNGSTYLVSTTFPGIGGSCVFSSPGFTGATWTATNPGSVTGL
jgi:hypothetical protein